jgi:membrane complex biogenesis BtpA family protein
MNMGQNSKHPQLVGMVHLPALPGSPRSELSIAAIEAASIGEARVLAEAGFDACIVENFGDAPFHGDAVEPITIAALTRIACSLRREFPELGLGINVLRNDASAALSIATASDSQFIRVNVHVGTTATDQGVLHGQAARTMRLRRALQAPVQVWGDVHVKHGRSLTHEQIEQEALDCVHRGLADALIVSGSGTGTETRLEDLQRVCALQLGVPVYVGSGITADNVQEYLGVADGVIVGTALKEGGRTLAPVDVERARSLVAKARKVSKV